MPTRTGEIHDAFRAYKDQLAGDEPRQLGNPGDATGDAAGGHVNLPVGNSVSPNLKARHVE